MRSNILNWPRKRSAAGVNNAAVERGRERCRCAGVSVARRGPESSAMCTARVPYRRRMPISVGWLEYTFLTAHGSCSKLDPRGARRRCGGGASVRRHAGRGRAAVRSHACGRSCCRYVHADAQHGRNLGAAGNVQLHLSDEVVTPWQPAGNPFSGSAYYYIVVVTCMTLCTHNIYVIHVISQCQLMPPIELQRTYSGNLG